MSADSVVSDESALNVVYVVSVMQRIYISDRRDSTRLLCQMDSRARVLSQNMDVMTAKKGLISWSFDWNLGRYAYKMF